MSLPNRRNLSRLLNKSKAPELFLPLPVWETDRGKGAKGKKNIEQSILQMPVTDADWL
jgi:hypothetical protein